MRDWTPIYMCFRPDTKSKQLHAACRQYIFESEEKLRRWLNARRNSHERIIVEVLPTGTASDQTRICGERCELAARESWPPLEHQG